MHVLLPRAMLKQLLKNGMDVMKQRKHMAALVRQNEAEIVTALAAATTVTPPPRGGPGRHSPSPKAARAGSPTGKQQRR